MGAESAREGRERIAQKYRAASKMLEQGNRGAAAPARHRAKGMAGGKGPASLVFKKGVQGPYRKRDFYLLISALTEASTMEIVEAERSGVPGVFIKDMSARMDIPSSRFFKYIGLAKATAEKKVASGQLVSGASGQAAIGVARLIGITQAIVENSTSEAARDFDAARWLGQWIERPQPSLGGRKPSELLDTPTGIDVVARLLGSIESGSYQ